MFVGSSKVNDLSSFRVISVGKVALRVTGAALAAICAIASAPALAEEDNAADLLPPSRDISTSGKLPAVGLALDYDFGFVTKAGGVPQMPQRAGEPIALTGPRMVRSLIVDGTEYGTGDVAIAEDKLYISTNLAAIAGLDCGEVRMAGDVSLCAVGTNKFWTEGDRLFVNAQTSKQASSLEPRSAPELKPGNLAFMNYDMSFVYGPDGSTSVFGGFHPALRLRENAFDIDASVFQSVSGSTARQATSDTRIALNSFAYRREWFEQRLRLTAGRTQSLGSGLAGGERFDGVTLGRFNSDDVGSVPSAGARPISGFAQGPGILQYRVGDKVYRQMPLREGKFEVPGEFIGDAPRGGRLEFVGLDGVAREIPIPTNISVQYAFYRPGDYSWQISLGRLYGAASGQPYASIGGRYGLLRDLTAELSLASSDRAFSASGTMSWRMPGRLGVVNVSGALQGNWNGKGAAASSAEANYYNRFGGVSFDLTHRVNFNGGYRGLGLTPGLLSQSDLTQTSRAALGFTLPFPGNDISFRLVAERSRFAKFPNENRLVQFDIGRSFGKLGSGLLLGRFGRDQYGQRYSSIIFNWTVPLGQRLGVTANYAGNRIGSQPTDNRYSATLWGSSAGTYGLGSNYQVSIDQDRRIAADGNYRTRAGALSASLTRYPGERPFGTVGMRGGLVLAGGDITATRQVSDSLLVLRSKELGGSKIYVPPDLEGRARFDRAGLGVITDLPAYREFNLSFDESGLPLGVEISRAKLNGSLRPYRGYIVDIPVVQLRPVRLFTDIPKEAFGQGSAFAGDSFAPIEVDGSIYFNSWPAAGQPVVLNWQTPEGPRSCTIEFPAAPARAAGATGFDIVELRGIACRPVEDN